MLRLKAPPKARGHAKPAEGAEAGGKAGGKAGRDAEAGALADAWTRHFLEEDEDSGTSDDELEGLL